MRLEGLDEAFFRDCWRRRPVVLRGAGRAWVDAGLDPDGWIERPPGRVRTDGRTVWFFEAITDQLPFTEQVVAAAREQFEWDDVWCDLFATRGATPSSIGCHYDSSDNFSVQLRGSKRWRLSPPSSLCADEVRRRLLGEPGVGRAELGDEVHEFVVHPGDALYIPHLWIDWGIAEADTASVSLVINAATPWARLRGPVLDALRREASWTEPLAVGPGAGPRRRAQLDAALDAFAPAAQRRIRPRLEVSVTTARPLKLDLDRVRAFLATAPEPPTGDLLLPDDRQVHRTLLALLSRSIYRRLLRQVVVRSEACGPADRDRYQRCADALHGCPDEVLERCLTAPELTSWVAVAEAASPADAPRAEDPLASDLAVALLPELVAYGARSPVRIPCRPDADGGFTLRRLGLRVALPQDELWVTVADGRPLVGDTALELGVDGVCAVPRLLGRGPHVGATPTAWARSQSRTAPHTGDEAEFLDAMGSGARVLVEIWPEAWAEVASCLRWLLPLPSRGLEPYNFSVHAFRGAVWCSPRREHRAAQSLVHETGHNKLSTLFDLFPLCANASEVVVSPVVNAERALSFVLHGCVAFSQDIALTRRLIGAQPTPSLERYLERTTAKVTAALAVLDERAELLPMGKRIRDEVAGLLAAEWR